MRLSVTAAAALLVMSAAASADPMKLTDQQMDKVTAGERIVQSAEVNQNINSFTNNATIVHVKRSRDVSVYVSPYTDSSNYANIQMTAGKNNSPNEGYGYW